MDGKFSRGKEGKLRIGRVAPRSSVVVAVSRKVPPPDGTSREGPSEGRQTWHLARDGLQRGDQERRKTERRAKLRSQSWLRGTSAAASGPRTLPGSFQRGLHAWCTRLGGARNPRIDKVLLTFSF